MKKMVMVFSLCLICMMSLGGTCLANWSYAYSSLYFIDNQTETRNYVLYEENPKAVGYNYKVELPDIWYKISRQEENLSDAFTYDPVTKIFTFYGTNINEEMDIYGEIKFTDDQQLVFTPSYSCSTFNAGEKILMKESAYDDHCFFGYTSTGSTFWLCPYLTDAMRYVLHNR